MKLFDLTIILTVFVFAGFASAQSKDEKIFAKS